MTATRAAGYRQAGYWWRVAGACAALAGALQAAPPQPGNAACATCHPAEVRSQPKSAMGIGIQMPGNQELLQEHPRLTLEANGYHYDIERKGGQSTYTVSDGSGALTLPVRYAFGVHNQTFVLEYQGGFYESLVSFYQKSGGLAITLGDGKVVPHNLTEAMGRRTSDEETVACFGCHSTGGVSQGKLTLAAMEPGVRCAHCHAGADAHMQARAAGKPATPLLNLGDMGAEEMSIFCGQCHGSWESVVRQRLFGERNVRFQPYRLANSRCFMGSEKRIRCTACHDPHADLVRQDASYDRACIACHGLKGSNDTGAAVGKPKACPVADRNCVSCHMPKVQAPGNPMIFTDHEIRVVHAGDPYPE